MKFTVTYKGNVVRQVEADDCRFDKDYGFFQFFNRGKGITGASKIVAWVNPREVLDIISEEA